MKTYTTKTDVSSEKKFITDDMFLTTDMPAAAGSKMLEGYISLFEAEAITRLKNGGYALSGKADVGEFAIDLLGETSYNGTLVEENVISNASAVILKEQGAVASLNLDVNGYVRRAAAQSGLVCVKPTYGTVSRFGTIPVACSGETVSVMAETADNCADVLSKISGHDDKDGTSLPEEVCKKTTEKETIKRVAVLKDINDTADEDVKAKLDSFIAMLKDNGIDVCEVECKAISLSNIAWNILMSAELCNNVSKYDGVKYGYRSENFTNIDELYTNSRTEAFGELLKTTILFGSETLSTENYMKVYDKALRMRRVIKEEFNKIFENCDALLLAACSKLKYTSDFANDKNIPFAENKYTAPASITGLPAVVAGGVQLVGKEFSEYALLDIVKMYEKEGE